MSGLLLEIATTFLSAPLEPDGWDRALGKMARETGSARGQLVAFGHDHAIPFNKVTDEPEGWFEGFVAIDGGNPAVNWRLACARAPFELAFEQDYAIARRRLRSDIYDDYARQYDMMHGCQTVLSHDSGGFFGLATLRTGADGPTTQEQRTLFAGLAPFALSAVKMQIALEHKGAQLAAETFEAMQAVAFLLDGKGRVMSQTAAADEFLRRPNCPLRLSNRHLVAARRSEDRSLGKAIQDVLGELQVRTPRVWLAGEHILDGHSCEIFSLPRREWTFGYEPRVLLVVRHADRRGDDEAMFLRQAMGLTRAEAEVARMIGRGHSREQVAQSRGTSATTVHAHLKSLFRKADVGREAELVALVSRLLN